MELAVVDVDLVDENWQPFTYRRADLVGITAFTASANRAYEIATAYREHGVPVVMGGVHCSMCTNVRCKAVCEAPQQVDRIQVTLFPKRRDSDA